TYDKHDVDKLKAFASQGNNLSELGWDLDGDPGEWDYVYWDEVSGKMRLTEFRVCGAGLALTGDLDLSDCVSLEYIDFDNRSDGDLCLSSINVSGCVSLRWFYCNDNLLTELDISGCTDLINLYCQNNLLTELDISGLANMSILDCSRNSLTELELNAHASYYEINVSFNLIENEDAVTGQTVTWDNCDFIFYPQKNSPYNAHDADKLKAFASQGNNLSELGWDLDGIPFEWNYTDWIWVSGEARLNYFDVCGANITLTGDLDLSGCTSLEYLDVDGSGHGVPGLTSLSVSGCTSLIWLYCSGNSLTSLNVSGCTDLKYLYCYDNSLTGLVLDAGASYDSIDVRYNLMKDESAVTGQTVEWDNYDLIFYPQKDSPYNKHDADKLKAFALQGNNLSELGWDLNANPVNWKYTDWVWVSGEARLYAFDVYYEGLTLRGDLDLSGCTSLDYLDFDNSGEGDLCLSSINVSGCTSLSWFYCNGNLLTQLNVSGCTGLRGLYCYDNLLTELDLSGCTGLEDLDCSGNLLTQLNVSGCTGLRELYCYDNLLTELDVSGLEYMEYLECGNNLLTELVLNADAFYYRIDVSNNFMEDEDAVTEQTIAWDGYDLIFYPQRTLRITIGTVDRTDTEVTVTFTSSSAGTYYYRIDGEKVDSGDLIGNTELTDTMIAGENTLTLTGLTAGAHIIYIEAADGDGNESNLLKILVPAYPGGDDSNGGGDSNGGVSMTVIAVAAVAAVAVIGFAAYFFLLKKP
ncbi:MAG: hypothetical protein FWG58_03470, partial [Methanomassiliicoccaceae archaeon]|nr:hypothetical protein [Methanomassiliicoccaceae archaeon]